MSRTSGQDGRLGSIYPEESAEDNEQIAQTWKTEALVMGFLPSDIDKVLAADRHRAPGNQITSIADLTEKLLSLNSEVPSQPRNRPAHLDVHVRSHLDALFETIPSNDDFWADAVFSTPTFRQEPIPRRVDGSQRKFSTTELEQENEELSTRNAELIVENAVLVEQNRVLGDKVLQLQQFYIPKDRGTVQFDVSSAGQEYTCKVCLDKRSNVAFLPCKHMVCCEVCAAQVDSCPVCRMAIQETLKLFLA